MKSITLNDLASTHELLIWNGSCSQYQREEIQHYSDGCEFAHELKASHCLAQSVIRLYNFLSRNKLDKGIILHM